MIIHQCCYIFFDKKVEIKQIILNDQTQGEKNDVNLKT
jgi:hypothetical protein